MSESVPKLTQINYKTATITQIEKSSDEMEKRNEYVEEIFKNERKLFNKELKDLFETLGRKDYKNYPELQSNTLAVRQELIDKISYYMNNLSKQNTLHRKSNADRIEYYMYGYGMKVSDSTRTKLIDRDLSERLRGVENIQNHIEFLRECKISCDNINYAVKNLTALMTYISFEK